MTNATQAAIPAAIARATLGPCIDSHLPVRWGSDPEFRLCGPSPAPIWQSVRAPAAVSCSARSASLRRALRGARCLGFPIDRTNPALCQSSAPRGAGRRSDEAERGSIYRPRLPQPDWIKVPIRHREEFVIAGYLPSARGFSTLILGHTIASGTSLTRDSAAPASPRTREG